MDPLTLLAAHMVGDYVLQTDQQARTKLADWRPRAVHVSTYTLAFLPAVWGRPWDVVLTFLALVWVTHFITDSRRWASGKEWAPKPILVDQAIHLATLAVLARVFAT